MDASERACEYLDRVSASDQSRVIVMDLLDEISAARGEIERLRREMDTMFANLIEARNVVAIRNGALEAQGIGAASVLPTQLPRPMHQDTTLRPHTDEDGPLEKA